MKKLSAAVLSAALLLAITGCNNDTSSDSSDESISMPASSETESEPVSSEQPESSDSSEVSDSAEEKSDTQTVTGSNGETIELRGTPHEPVSEFSYDKFSERWATNIAQGAENGLVELLDGLGKPEVKEVYIKARAILDGFYADGYSLSGEDVAGIAIKKENGFADYFEETQFTYDSFIKEMHAIFGEQVTEDILENKPLFYEYDGRLWQYSVYPGCSVYTTKYELVQNLDDVVEFNSRIYYLDDMPDYEFDPEKAETYRKRIISNRVVKTPDGWRVENCQMFSDVSALPGEENVRNFSSAVE